MQITDLHTTKKGRISVYVDGEFTFTVDQESCLMAKLKIGQEVSIEGLNELMRASQLKAAKEKALGLLSRRSYSKGQLKERLTRHTDEEAALEAVERMEEIGLVDDLDYALRFARDLYHLKHLAPARIKQELRQKGIDSEIISESLEQFDQDDNVERALSYLGRKYSSLSDEKIRKRAFAQLQRLGYSYSEIGSALRLYDEEQEQ